MDGHGGGRCSLLHASQSCVTVGIQYVDFAEAAHVGDIVSIKAKLTRVFTSSMEVFVQAFARKVKSQKKFMVSGAYFTFVALDDDGKPTKAISLKPTTDSEKRNFDNALKRRKLVSSMKNRIRIIERAFKKLRFKV